MSDIVPEVAHDEGRVLAQPWMLDLPIALADCLDHESTDQRHPPETRTVALARRRRRRGVGFGFAELLPFIASLGTIVFEQVSDRAIGRGVEAMSARVRSRYARLRGRLRPHEPLPTRAAEDLEQIYRTATQLLIAQGQDEQTAKRLADALVSRLARQSDTAPETD